MREIYLQDPKDLYDHVARTWVEVDMDKLRNNLSVIASQLQEGTGIIPVLKANAYGHGAVEIARAIADCTLDGDYPISGFAVATLDEGIDLRKAGISQEVLLLSSNENERFDQGISNHLTYAVPNYEYGLKLNQVAKELDTVAKVHIALDTGMSRLGFRTDDPDNIDKILRISHLQNLEITGIFTHFATADGEDYSLGYNSSFSAENYLNQQIKSYKNFVENLEKSGVKVRLHHVANSGAISRGEDYSLDAVRPGLILYGINASANMHISGLEPVTTWKTRVLQVKEINPGDTVGYGRKYTASEKRKIAVLAVGYADGYSRCMQTKASVSYRGEVCPVIGSIYMDMLTIDCTDLSFEPKEGDVVDLMTSELTSKSINIYAHASWRSTIPYEVLTSISYRCPRVYLRSGTAYKIAWL